MNDKQHSVIERWERRWLGIASSMSLIFVILIAGNLAIEGQNVAQLKQRASLDEVLSSDIFSNPGVTEIAPNKYRVAVLAQTFSFNPNEIRLPVGATAEFYVTSKDVLHGFQVAKTNTNMEVIPGEVAYSTHSFDQVGEYWVTCNEYCGIGHQNMLAKIIILPKAVYAQEMNAEADTAAATTGGANTLGEKTYNANCSGCHQANGTGLAGAFPPLKDNIANTFTLDGGKDYLLAAVLNGLSGPIKVNGDNFNGAMPAWSQLSNEEISATLNYALSSWGSSLDAGITSEDVESARNNSLSTDKVLELRNALGLE